MVVCVCVLIY